MASNKERLSDLETCLGMLQDEIVQINEVICGLEQSFRQMLAEAVAGLQEGGSTAPKQVDVRRKTTIRDPCNGRLPIQ